MNGERIEYKCECGNTQINIGIFSDRLEAEMEEGLRVLVKKYRIILKKNSVSCIDSIEERNKDIKE